MGTIFPPAAPQEITTIQLRNIASLSRTEGILMGAKITVIFATVPLGLRPEQGATGRNGDIDPWLLPWDMAMIGKISMGAVW